jgi:hypothetical protein
MGAPPFLDEDSGERFPLAGGGMGTVRHCPHCGGAITTRTFDEAELERVRSLLYRATAPTASPQEEDDRQAAILEGYELTRERGKS